jgi:hypothetical protein
LVLGWSYEHRALVTAVTSLNSQWEKKIADANTEASGADLVRLCRADPACRKVAKK